MSHRKTTCEGCGCNCRNCTDPVGGSLHLHVEIENLKQRLLERENHIVKMETNFLREAEKFPNGEMAALTDELLTWQDKYSRLYEAHKRVQKVNQNLEDKLLKIVDKCETEKSILTAEVAALTRRLVDEKFSVSKLQEENERYRNDVNLAIQLLQCKPSNFVPQKYDSLPIDLQQKVRTYVSSKRRISVSDSQQKPPEMKTIKVPIPTFPPTAMVYSVNKSPSDKDAGGVGCEEKNSRQASMDIVSAAIMAKVLEERERERSQMKHCDTCTCSSSTSAVNNDHSNKYNSANSNSNFNNDNRRHLINKATQTNNNINISEPLVVSSNGNKLVDVNVNLRDGISNNSNATNISSPMNIRRCIKSSGVNNITSSSSGVVFTNENKIETDFFSDFNMVAMDENLSGDKNNKGYFDNHDDKLFVSSNVMAISTDNLLLDNTGIDKNRKLMLDCKNTDNKRKDIVDNEDINLIIFDKQPPLSSTATAVTTMVTASGQCNVSSSTTSNRSGGARHCSVRLQAGTSNILLDNVVDGPYAPVLYKSRQQSFDPLLVHVPLPSQSRSVSGSSSVSSSCNEDQRLLPDTINNINTASNSSSALFSSSSPSSSSSSSSSSSFLAPSLSSSAVISQKNLTFAQIRTETEI